MVIVSYLVFAFFSTENGFINNTIFKILGKEPVSWYMEKKYWPFIIVFVNLWKTIGYNCIVYMSAIVGFDRGYYEAAAIDGATSTQQLFKITLPLLNKTTALILMLQIIASFKVFQQIWLITKGGPGRATRPLIQYIYEQGFQKQKLGYACSMSFVLFFILIVLTLIQRKIQGKGEKE